MYCRICGESIPDNSEICPECGENQGRTRETEKDEKSGAGKIAGKIVKGIVIVGTPLATIVGQELLDGVGKAVTKKAGKATNSVLKTMGLKKKTPLDMGKKALKNVKKTLKK